MPVWIIAMQWLSRAILALLLFLSVGSVATMIRCARGMKLAGGDGQNLDSEVKKVTVFIEKKEWTKLEEWARQGQSLYAGSFRAILNITGADASRVDRALKSYLSFQRTELEEGLTVLATLGSNAPFIGLFGTVLGIIQAFGALGAHQNNTSDIMIGISEALIATAVGLIVAIPAVVAFNLFSRKLRVFLVNSEALKDLYLSNQKGEL